MDMSVAELRRQIEDEVRQLEAEQAALATRVAELRAKRDRLNVVVDELTARTGHVAETTQKPAPVDRWIVGSTRGTVVAEGEFRDVPFLKAIQTILGRANEPLSTQVIVDALRTGNYRSASKDLKNVTRSQLTRLAKTVPESGVRKVGALWALGLPLPEKPAVNGTTAVADSAMEA